MRSNPASPLTPPAAERTGTPSTGKLLKLGIVASTGGAAAVCKILRKLPRDFSAPVLLVQHITSEFSQSFVDWLTGNLALRVCLAEQEEFTLRGSVYVAPPEYHMHWENRRTELRACWRCVNPGLIPLPKIATAVSFMECQSGCKTRSSGRGVSLG